MTAITEWGFHDRPATDSRRNCCSKLGGEGPGPMRVGPNARPGYVLQFYALKSRES